LVKLGQKGQELLRYLTAFFDKYVEGDGSLSVQVHSENTTKEQLENEIKNLTTKTNEAIVDILKSTKTNLLSAKDFDDMDKLREKQH